MNNSLELNCNCDMPLWAYRDWLADNGWNTEGMEEECGLVYGFFHFGATGFKTYGCSIWIEETMDEDAYGYFLKRAYIDQCYILELVDCDIFCYGGWY